jgi:hypothetical protein
MERHMFTETKKVFAVAAAIVVIGVTGVELTRSTAQAETAKWQRSPVVVAAYAGARVDTTFDVVADMPRTADIMLPLAMKGDLPVPLGCRGIDGDAQAECMDVAYETDSPSVVVETRVGSTSTLERLDPVTVATFSEGELPQSE